MQMFDTLLTTHANVRWQVGGMIYAKYNIYWTNKHEGDLMYQVLIEFPGFTKVADALKPILREINKKLIEQMKNFSLKDIPDMYRLYSAKKTGKPKLDYPRNFPYVCVVSQSPFLCSS